MTAGNKKQWLLPASVAVAVLCLLFAGGKNYPPANAKTQCQIATEGSIRVIPIQLERNNYGIAMVDTVSQTLWIYELNSRGSAQNRLKLLAARSFQYDRHLQQYNTARPFPQQVKMILEESAQQQKGDQSESQVNENDDKTAGFDEK